MERRNERLKQLLKQDPVAMGMLGVQSIRKQAYRPLTYILTAEESDKNIYFNLLTHEMVVVNLSELELPETRKYLIENWYLVPEEHDDQQLVDECRTVMTLMDSWPKKIHAFTIFTTLDCNARCFYCFEKRIPASNMTKETATKVIEYMQEQSDGDPIKIIWFGGEPLFNYPIIDFISIGLKEKGLTFKSKMISNGLLFDSMIIERAKNLWNLKVVQITLDGTRESYRRVKAYTTDVVDPFEKVLQNIKSLLRFEIRVSVRLNVGLYNYNDMQDLVEFLCEEFKEENNLYVYADALFEIINYADEKKKFMYDFLDKLNNKLAPFFGKKKDNEFPRKIVNSSCMASGREAVTILPDGKVGICPDVTDSAFLGDIYTKDIDFEIRKDFGRRFYRDDKCRSCSMYPNCYIVNGCPNKDDKEGCDSVEVQWKIRKIKEKMINRYRMNMTENE